MTCEIIEQPRHYCALGSQQTVLGIERAFPIVHSGPGCSAKLFNGLSFLAGFQGVGYSGGDAIACTNSTEREVVFGGEGRLREVIDGAIKIIDADLFVVLTGCTADIVGDDTGSVVQEFKEKGVPIVYAETGGFKGDSYKGHELVCEAIIEQYLKPSAEKIPKLVNVWSVLPYQDPFWEGNLSEIKKLLTGIGLIPNVLYGYGSGGIKAWNKIPSAEFNLVLSPWIGLNTAKLLQKKFGTPYLHYPILPIGAVETSKFLRTVGEYVGVDKAVYEKFINEKENEYYHYIERAADFFLEFKYGLPDRFINALDSFYSLGISKFLVNDIGILPAVQFVTENVPEEFREGISEEFQKLSDTVKSDVIFASDGGDIRKKILEYKGKYSPVIIGSSWERDVAAEIEAYHISLNTPVVDRLILNKGYVGYDGGLQLAEDIYTSVLHKDT